MQKAIYSDSKSYSRDSLEKIIIDLFESYNIFIHARGVNELNVFCPFHKNVHSPAFYINTKTGLWQCFNPSCGKKGNFRQLYRAVTGKPFTKDMKLDPIALSKELEKGLKYQDEEDSIGIDISDIEIDYSDEDQIQYIQYFIDRGLSPETLRIFEIGYSKLKERIVIPVRDAQYKLVGFIGRAIHDYQEPRYLYNTGFKRAEVLFNLQNAKKHNSCIVVEGSVDAMFVHQAGFPNVVATLGARVSPKQLSMLKKYFDEITVFSDNDDAGNQMRDDIMDGCRGKDLYTVKYPDNKKDPGEMTQQEIITTLTNKIIGGW